MIMTLISIIALSIGFLAVGFARQEDPIVKVPLKSSVRIRGNSYHPTSEGREMPRSHAEALGFTERDFIDYESEDEEEPTDGESSTGEEEVDESESAEESEGQAQGEESEAEVEEEPEDQEEAADSEEEQPAPEASDDDLPEDTPMRDKLIADERFSTVSALLANKDQLTDVKGVGEKTAQEIVEHVT